MKRPSMALQSPAATVVGCSLPAQEHMLFYSSERFPEEDAYSKCVRCSKFFIVL